MCFCHHNLPAKPGQCTEQRRTALALSKLYYLFSAAQSRGFQTSWKLSESLLILIQQTLTAVLKFMVLIFTHVLFYRLPVSASQGKWLWHKEVAWLYRGNAAAERYGNVQRARLPKSELGNLSLESRDIFIVSSNSGEMLWGDCSHSVRKPCTRSPAASSLISLIF